MNMQSTFDGEVGHLVSIKDEHVISLGKVARKFYGGDNFSREVLQHLVEHGLKQKLGDAYNVFKGSDSEKMQQAHKVWDALVDGKFRMRRAESDPIERYARQLGLKYLAKNTRGWEKLSNEDKKAELDAFLESAQDETPNKIAAAIYAKAEQMVEIESSLADLEL